MDCPKCGANFEGDKCPFCGCVIEKPEPNVQNVTIINNYAQPEQEKPVNRMDSIAPEPSSPKSKSMAMILACLTFIGLGGLNRFYVGKNTSGLLYFCTFGLFFIGAIADIKQISAGKFTDNNGLPLKK